jgi:hypothetical protein
VTKRTIKTGPESAVESLRQVQFRTEAERDTAHALVQRVSAEAAAAMHQRLCEQSWALTGRGNDVGAEYSEILATSTALNESMVEGRISGQQAGEIHDDLRRRQAAVDHITGQLAEAEQRNKEWLADPLAYDDCLRGKYRLLLRDWPW